MALRTPNLKFAAAALLTTALGAWLVFMSEGRDAQAELSLPPSTSPVVVELFTSQSCSSCPPADALLVDVEPHANIIALGCHVTYWNHLDWRDTLSHSFCTDRQRAYAAERGTRRVYTPQAVVNGSVEFVGSDRKSMVEAIASPRQAVLSIAIQRADGDVLVVTLPGIENAERPMTVWLAGFQRQYTQKMRAGENRGRTVLYVNPVLTMDQVGVWDGQAKTMELAIPLAALEAINGEGGGVAVLAQQGVYGPIMAAGKVEFSNPQ